MKIFGLGSRRKHSHKLSEVIFVHRYICYLIHQNKKRDVLTECGEGFGLGKWGKGVGGKGGEGRGIIIPRIIIVSRAF
jgi:hypothetical protein